jgi:hypothetical protein
MTRIDLCIRSNIIENATLGVILNEVVTANGFARSAEALFEYRPHAVLEVAHEAFGRPTIESQDSNLATQA